MQYITVKNAHILEICSLYKQIFNYDMDHSFYCYLYQRDNDTFDSVIALDDKNRIVGHNAFIKRQYSLNGKDTIIGLSSGGMVLPDYSGIFFQILKKNIALFDGDIIIAFPNKNSEGFFTKIFNFSSIPANYFTLKRSDFEINSQMICDDIAIINTNSDINWRLERHPKNKYCKIQHNGCELWYKQFGCDQADILYVNSFDENFKIILKKMLEEFAIINIIHWDAKYISSLGFKDCENNKFTWKIMNSNIKLSTFPCQMIDSDVF